MIIVLNYQLNYVPDTDEYNDLILDSVGELFVRVGGRDFYHDDYALIFEIAVAISNWLALNKKKGNIDFHYESLDQEEAPLLALNFERKTGLYKPVSYFQKFESKEGVELENVKSAFQSFIDEVQKDFSDRNRLDLVRYLDDRINS